MNFGKLELDHVIKTKTGDFGMITGINTTKEGQSYVIESMGPGEKLTGIIEAKEIDSRWIMWKPQKKNRPELTPKCKGDK